MAVASYRAASGCDLTRDLLDLDDDELRWLERGKADNDVHDAQVDVGLSRGLAIALHEVRIARRAALERALSKQALHEGADVQADLRPERFVVGLEDHPLRAAVQAFLEEERHAPHRYVLPLRATFV